MSDEQVEEEKKALVELREPRTQTELRYVAFANEVLKEVNVAVAYRNVYDPGKDIEPKHYVAGSKLMKDPYVGVWIGELAKHALADNSVDRAHAIKRLLQTIDSDITDYLDARPPVEKQVEEEFYNHETKQTERRVVTKTVERGFMSLAQIRQNLPLEKRRLIRKYTERLKDGEVVSRTIEMEPKQPAVELLSRIQKWVSPGEINVVQAGMIVNVITAAHATALRKKGALLPALEGSKTATQISRSQIAQKALAPPTDPQK